MTQNLCQLRMWPNVLFITEIKFAEVIYFIRIPFYLRSICGRANRRFWECKSLFTKKHLCQDATEIVITVYPQQKDFQKRCAWRKVWIMMKHWAFFYESCTLPCAESSPFVLAVLPGQKRTCGHLPPRSDSLSCSWPYFFLELIYLLELLWNLAMPPWESFLFLPSNEGSAQKHLTRFM